MRSWARSRPCSLYRPGATFSSLAPLEASQGSLGSHIHRLSNYPQAGDRVSNHQYKHWELTTKRISTSPDQSEGNTMCQKDRNDVASYYSDHRDEPIEAWTNGTEIQSVVCGAEKIPPKSERVGR